MLALSFFMYVVFAIIKDRSTRRSTTMQTSYRRISWQIILRCTRVLLVSVYELDLASAFFIGK